MLLFSAVVTYPVMYWAMASGGLANVLQVHVGLLQHEEERVVIVDPDLFGGSCKIAVRKLHVLLHRQQISCLSGEHKPTE